MDGLVRVKTLVSLYFKNRKVVYRYAINSLKLTKTVAARMILIIKHVVFQKIARNCTGMVEIAAIS